MVVNLKCKCTELISANSRIAPSQHLTRNKSIKYNKRQGVMILQHTYVIVKFSFPFLIAKL